MNIKLIIVLLLCCFLLSCDDLGIGNNKNLQDAEIYKGKEGVAIEIIDNALPSNVFENENFELLVRATNKGPISTSVKLSVATEKPYLTFITGSYFQQREVQLEGKEPFQQIDDFEVEVFNIKGGQIDPLSETHTGLVIVSACYDYISKTFSDVCIDTDPHNLRPIVKTCSQSILSLTEGQGGPLVITSIEPRMLLQGDYIKPQFKIYLENQGPGSVTTYGNTNKMCSNQEKDIEDYNTLDISDLKLNVAGYTENLWSCVPEMIRLRSKQDYVICSLKENVQGIPKDRDPFLTPLKIELKYGYALTQTREVVIEKVLSH
ncbi:hypothetical protein JW930_04710 [Candidatus Woesearchaeota archaeon]|nr:hypothetical protein [Candidatus Woesearchaeota archaeon]